MFKKSLLLELVIFLGLFLTKAITKNEPTQLEIRIHSDGAGPQPQDLFVRKKLKSEEFRQFLAEENKLCNLSRIENPVKLECMGIKSTFEQNGEDLVLNLYFEWSHALARERQAIAANNLYAQLGDKESFSNSMIKNLDKDFSNEGRQAKKLFNNDQYKYSFSAFSHFGNVVLMLHELNSEKKESDSSVKAVLQATSPLSIHKTGALNNKISHATFFGTPILPETDAILAQDDLRNSFPKLIFCSSENDATQILDRVSSRYLKNFIYGPKRFPTKTTENKDIISSAKMKVIDQNNQEIKVDHIKMYLDNSKHPCLPISKFRDQIQKEIHDKQGDLVITLSADGSNNVKLESTPLPEEKYYYLKSTIKLSAIPVGLAISIYKLFYLYKEIKKSNTNLATEENEPPKKINIDAIKKYFKSIPWRKFGYCCAPTGIGIATYILSNKISS